MNGRSSKEEPQSQSIAAYIAATLSTALLVAVITTRFSAVLRAILAPRRADRITSKNASLDVKIRSATVCGRHAFHYDI